MGKILIKIVVLKLREGEKEEMESNIRNFESLSICSPLCLGFSFKTKYATILHTKNQMVHGKIALHKSDPNNKQVRAIVSVY